MIIEVSVSVRALYQLTGNLKVKIKMLLSHVLQVVFYKTRKKDSLR